MLFEFGSVLARDRGLILVDTKYEFGFYNGEIILMDELHTCDSEKIRSMSKLSRKAIYAYDHGKGLESLCHIRLGQSHWDNCKNA